MALDEHLFDVTLNESKWFVVGDKGVVLSATDPRATWSSRRLGDGDRSWHTSVEVVGEALYLSGQNLLLIEKDKANLLAH